MSVLKKCKVVVLSTEKASTNFSMIMNTKNELRLPANPFKYNVEKYNKEGFDCYNLYIISDDEIKEGDWFYNSDADRDGENTIEKATRALFESEKDFCKKIIATTDSSLTVIGNVLKNEGYHLGDISLPQPSQSFINKFIEEYNKGNVITDVMVEYDNDIEYWESRGGHQSGGKFKVFQKPQFGEYPCIMDYYPVKLKVDKNNYITISKIKDSWSREEVVQLLNKFAKYTNDEIGRTIVDEDTTEWIEENL